MGEEIGQDLENVMSSSPTADIDGHALPRVLVEHGEQLQGSTVVRSGAHEVVGPDVVHMQRH